MDLRAYYRQARTTAVFPDAVADDYLVVALLGEIGEFANAYKKVLRGDYPLSERRDQFIGELGDVLWYVAVYFAHLGVLDAVDTNPSEKRVRLVYPNIALCLRKLNRHFAQLEPNAVDASTPESVAAANVMYQCLVAIALHLDTTLNEVAERNLSKLADRHERGLIRGDGDER